MKKKKNNKNINSHDCPTNPQKSKGIKRIDHVKLDSAILYSFYYTRKTDAQQTTLFNTATGPSSFYYLCFY